MFLSVNDYFLKEHQLIDLVMVMDCVFFEVRTGCLYIITTGFGFKRSSYMPGESEKDHEKNSFVIDLPSTKQQ
jgi:hypothetical protein